MSQQHGIDGVLEGFRRFQDRYFTEDSELFDRLRHGQTPKMLVVSCCDSRVDPLLMTGCEPGDLFVVRNVANLVPPCEDHQHETHHSVSAALEFGVRYLEVEHIVVLGHAGCGGIRSLCEGAGHTHDSYLGKWLSIAEPARERVQHALPDSDFETQVAACERASILVSLENLLTFPWVSERIEKGTLALHGWYFDIHSGALEGVDLASGEFRPLVNSPLPVDSADSN